MTLTRPTAGSLRSDNPPSTLCLREIAGRSNGRSSRDLRRPVSNSAAFLPGCCEIDPRAARRQRWNRTLPPPFNRSTKWVIRMLIRVNITFAALAGRRMPRTEASSLCPASWRASIPSITPIFVAMPVAKTYGFVQGADHIWHERSTWQRPNHGHWAILSPRAQALALYGATCWTIAFPPPCRHALLRKAF